MAIAEPETPRAPRVLPWKLLARIALAWALLLGPVLYLFGPGYAGVTALVGLVPAFGGQIVGQRHMAYAASVSLIAGIGVFALFSNVTWAWAGAVLLILCAGFEAHRTGGRAFVLALYGWCGLALAPNLPAASDALPFIALGAIWGTLTARLLLLGGLAAIPPLDARYSISLCVFLMLGLLVAVKLNSALSQEYGYWVVLLFVLRALSPPKEGLKTALVYGFGAAVGSAIALLLTLSPASAELKFAIALCLSIGGLRYLPHPGPWSAAAFTSAILLLLPVGVDGVVIRAEAAAIAVGLTVGLIVMIGLCWSLLWRLAGERETGP